MKKKMIYAFTAAMILAVVTVQPMTALAASNAYRIFGNNQSKMLIRDGEYCDIEGLPGSWKSNCEKPEDQRPETQRPDIQDTWVQQILTLVNRERLKAGLTELKMNPDVNHAAQIRAHELASNFSHIRPDGSSFSTALKTLEVSYIAAGENIAYGQNSPEIVMEQWMNSPGHRSNILNPNFTEIGVGHYESVSGVHYWAQIFIK